MFGKCRCCGVNVGYFALTDGFCKNCIANKDVDSSKLRRIVKSMPIVKWLLPLMVIFQLSSPWIFEQLSNDLSPNANSSSIPMQIAFSITLVVSFTIACLTCFILRFYVIRRRLHVVAAWIVFLGVFFIPVGITAALGDGGPLGLASLLYLVAGYKVLRIENLKVDYTEQLS